METVPLNQDQKNKIMSLPTLSEHLPYTFVFVRLTPSLVMSSGSF